MRKHFTGWHYDIWPMTHPYMEEPFQLGSQDAKGLYFVLFHFQLRRHYIWAYYLRVIRSLLVNIFSLLSPKAQHYFQHLAIDMSACIDQIKSILPRKSIST
uniref:Uncharacterized protein n=1 Tax=Arundo donax TaxID=35708 RepID=A0A0A9FEH2_ARUDO